MVGALFKFCGNRGDQKYFGNRGIDFGGWTPLVTNPIQPPIPLNVFIPSPVVKVVVTGDRRHNTELRLCLLLAH